VTDGMAGALVASLSGSGAIGTAITIDPQPLTSQSPSVTKTVSAGIAEMAYLGDGFMAASGAYLSVTYLATEGTYWCVYTSSSADTYTLTAHRWKARTAPE
jgi:hypothetical protein